MLALSVMLAGCVLCACSPRIGGSEGVDAVNDALRSEREALKDTLRAAELERDEWRAKAEALAGGTDGIKSLLVAIPAVVRLEIDPRSQIEVSVEGAPKLKASIVSLDGRDRFTPLVGELRWQLMRTPVQGQGEGQILQLFSMGGLDAGSLREAYRSSFLGTHYVIETEAAAESVRFSPGETFVLEVIFTDAATGRLVSAEAEVDVVARP